MALHRLFVVVDCDDAANIPADSGCAIIVVATAAAVDNNDCAVIVNDVIDVAFVNLLGGMGQIKVDCFVPERDKEKEYLDLDTFCCNPCCEIACC